MANATTAITRLAYDPEEDLIKADLIAENGGRAAHIQLRFPFRHHEDRPTTDLRAIALTEIQQILRTAANLMLPDVMNAGNGTVTEAGRRLQSGTDAWENEGGNPPAYRHEIVWIGI